MTSDHAWQEAKQRYPVGTRARGQVKAKFNFGVFLTLDGAPDVNGFVDLSSYNPSTTEKGAPTSLPEVGETVEGTVVDLIDRDKQIRIRVGTPFWERKVHGGAPS
ncbi:hypothetical protein E3E14_18865 [Streptomyces sp. ICN441]|uniref:hypothetical protein n=1 Tax=Streptomyces sp. ICN441 TaxID=2558286 RepID=UPI00106969DF|nr:hypothetical protein [Streptomyces sp. ICN441]TFE48155.1 hypothetical protein E3E14_18865 [Streptomyces sp. ICN441]